MPFVPWERVPQQMNVDATKSPVNQTEPLCLVVNPRAGAGRAGARLDELKRAAARAFAHWDLRLTEAPGHAAAIAAEAVERGFGIVAAVGGDGTCHEVVQGMVQGRKARSNRCAFSTLAFGTGGDLVRTLEVPGHLSEAMWVLATGITLPTDVGQVTWPGTEGPRRELFINVAGFGANGDVVRRANAMDKRMGGRATFLLATLRTTRDFAGGHAALRWRDESGAERTWEGPVLAGFVANGGACGGGMRVGRGGTMQDGLFDVTLLPPAPLPVQLRHVHHLYDGHIDRIPGSLGFRATELWVEASAAEFPLDLDGEARTGLPVHLEVLPAALQVRGGWIRNPVRGDRGRQFG